MDAVWVGIDVSKAWLDVGLWPGSETFRLSNDASGVAELAERLRALGPRAVVLESTGGWEVLAASDGHPIA